MATKSKEKAHDSLTEVKPADELLRIMHQHELILEAAGEGIDLQELKNLSTKEAKRKLIEFKGVGNKVSECVLLFSLEKYDVFPIDTWVKKILEYFYKNEVEKYDSPETFLKNYFELNAGYAQQYLFYYARENKIGG